MSNFINQVPYLRTSREFPEDIKQLTQEVNKSYIDIAGAVNVRTIGIFPISRPAITGESWYIYGNRRQQSVRQVFNITSLTSFNHNLFWDDIQFFSVIRGIGYDGTNYYPIPYVNATDATANIGIYVTPTQVVFTTGADSPVITSALIILEWLSQT